MEHIGSAGAGGKPRAWLPNASGLVWLDRSKILFSEIKSGIHMAIVTSDENRAAARDVYVPAHQRGMAHRSYPSPDRKWVLVVEMDERGAFGPCRLVPFEGGSPGRQVGPLNGACTFAAWSPDGKWMYFSSNVRGADHVWRQHFPDGQAEQITSGPTEEEGVAIAPDGGSFITAAGVKQSAIWLHDGRGERQISLEGYASLPKFTPDGKRLCYVVRAGSSRELRIADVEFGRSEPLLPGLPLGGSRPYDISADGRKVVVTSRDAGGKLGLWVAPLDRRSAPRQIPGVDGEGPLFGRDGEVFFRKVEGNSGFIYQVREDGTELRKVVDVPLYGTEGISPDYRWLLAFSGAGQQGTGYEAFPLGGGPPVRVPASNHKWSGDGKTWFIGAPSSDVTHVVPLPPGKVFPMNAAGTVPFTNAEIEKIPGVRLIQSGDVAPGPDWRCLCLLARNRATKSVPHPDSLGAATTRKSYPGQLSLQVNHQSRS